MPEYISAQSIRKSTVTESLLGVAREATGFSSEKLSHPRSTSGRLRL